MSLFKTCYLIYSKMCLRNPAFILCILLLPLSVAGILLSMDSENNFAIGIYATGDDMSVNQIYTRLESNNQYRFEIVGSEAELEEKVSQGIFELGYVFLEGFSKQVEKGDLYRLVKVVKYEDDWYHNFINIQIFESIYEQVVPYLTLNYLEENEIKIELDTIETEIEENKNSENAFSIAMNSENKEDQIENEQWVMPMIRGLICIFLLALTIIFAISIPTKKQLFSAYVNPYLMKFYSVIPAYTYSLASAIIALVIANLELKQGTFSIVREIGYLMLLQISLAIFSLIISKLIKSEILMVCLPFLIVGVVVTHPIFFDITFLFPNLEKILRFLPTYSYCSGMWWYGSFFLLAIGSGMLIRRG